MKMQYYPHSMQSYSLKKTKRQEFNFGNIIETEKNFSTNNNYSALPLKTASYEYLLKSSCMSTIPFGAKLLANNYLPEIIDKFASDIKGVDLDLIFSDIRGLKISREGIVDIPDEYKSFKDSLGKILQLFPEFKATIGRKQHFPQKYNIDGHLLATVQNCIKDNEYANLSESGRRVLTISALLHDIGKKEKIVDKEHPIKSAAMIKEIMHRLQLLDEEKRRIYNTVKNHHWVEDLSNYKDPKDIITDLIVSEDLDLLKIFARADLKAFGHKASINRYKDSWLDEAKRIEAELIPQVKTSTVKKYFNYPTHKPSEKDGFYYYENNPFIRRNFLEGQTAYIEYINRGDKKVQTAIGTVTCSENAVWELTNHETEKVQELNTNYCDIKEIWLKPSEEKIEDLLLKSKDPVGHLRQAAHLPHLKDLRYEGHDNAVQTIAKYREPFGIIQSQNNGNPFVLTGKFKVVESVDGYSVLQIETCKGEKYLFDLNYTSNDTNIAINSDGYNPELEKFQINNGRPVNIIDFNRPKRVKIVNELIDDIYINKKSPFETEKFYSFLAEDMEQTEKLINQWYGEDTGKELIQKVEKNLGRKNIVLLGDPGIASRINSLIKFTQTPKFNFDKISPYELRQEFSKYLGVTKVYRGMAITEQQSLIIQRNGLLAPGLLDNKKLTESLFNVLGSDSIKNKKDTHTSGYYVNQIIARVDYDKNNDDIYSSCSKHKDVASSIGWYSQKKGKNNVYPYLIEMDVPTISVIEQKGIFDNLTDLCGRIGEKFSVGTNNIYKSDDPDVEVFVPFVVNPENFKIYKTNKPLRWYGEASPDFNISAVTDD